MTPRTPKIKKEEVKEVKKAEAYAEGVGRRKTAVARVRITGGHGGYLVNDKKVDEYFRVFRFQSAAWSPLKELKLADRYSISAKVSGGGPKAQAEAVRLGLARALALKNPDSKNRLRVLGLLTRDPRMVERKKYGLKKARRAPQWAKR